MTQFAAEGKRTGESVLATFDAGVLRVSLNRPDRLNALTTEVIEDVADVVAQAGADSSVRVLVLAGNGRSFCSGADLSMKPEPGWDPPADIIDAGNRLTKSLTEVPVPVICAVQGAVAGISVSFALACDFVLARPDAYFLLPFVHIGLMPDGGATAIVAASIGRARALKLAMLGERLPATDALAAGLIAAVHEDLDEAVNALAARLSVLPPNALASSKLAINGATLGSLGAAFEKERAGQLDLLRADDFIEGVAAFGEKRKPVFGQRSITL
ncbi:MAG TPA: enoyl-CoA hydratase [Sporichthyaceae bacterium]|jgi:enoyl-CoA hydratase